MKLSKCIDLAGALVLGGALFASAAPKPKSTAELEKEKALANPYPNDFGPDKLPEDYVNSLPAEAKEGYKFLLLRCTQCHTSSRPLNSRFIEPAVAFGMKPGPERDKKEDEAVKALRGAHPDYFAAKGVWQIESGVWNRYVKRMLNKPGCGVSQGGHMTIPEAGKIYQFLVYDGEHRKLGGGADKWKAHREGLIGKLKAEKPARYEELAKDNDL